MSGCKVATFAKRSGNRLRRRGACLLCFVVLPVACRLKQLLPEPERDIAPG